MVKMTELNLALDATLCSDLLSLTKALVLMRLIPSNPSLSCPIFDLITLKSLLQNNAKGPSESHLCLDFFNSESFSAKTLLERWWLTCKSSTDSCGLAFSALETELKAVASKMPCYQDKAMAAELSTGDQAFWPLAAARQLTPKLEFSLGRFSLTVQAEFCEENPQHRKILSFEAYDDYQELACNTSQSSDEPISCVKCMKNIGNKEKHCFKLVINKCSDEFDCQEFTPLGRFACFDEMSFESMSQASSDTSEMAELEEFELSEDAAISSYKKECKRMSKNEMFLGGEGIALNEIRNSYRRWQSFIDLM
jgi:hypothetical protein